MSEDKCPNGDPGSLCSTSGVGFEVVLSSAVWGVTAATIPFLCALLFHRFEMKTTNRQLAGFLLAWTSVGCIPFVAYLHTGVSWTGLKLSDVQLYMIESRHAVLLFIWLIVSCIQFFAILVNAKSVHTFFGNIGQNYLLPIVVLELVCNAVFVFLPDKPYFLAIAILRTAEPTVKEIIKYAFAFTVALCTPIYMALFVWLSKLALHNKRFRTHGVYIALVAHHAIMPGILRSTLRAEFTLSGCTPFKDQEISAVIQASALNLTVNVSCVVSTMLFCTVPLQQRQKDPYIRGSFVFVVLTHAISLGASYLLGVPGAIQCSDYRLSSRL